MRRYDRIMQAIDEGKTDEELAEMFPAGIYAIGVVGMATSSFSRVTSALTPTGNARQMQAHRHSARNAVRRGFMLLRM